MHDPADPTGLSRAALRAALLDYSRSPGKYQVGLRQPQPLFAALRDVLQIAVGRDGAAAPGAEQESISVRDAARFFVRTALLYPGADHYALLGLDRKAEHADLKDRYRLMMRLLHPDFSGPGAGAWPADAAVRVNRAYDTLSSAVQRRAYDEALGQGQITGTVPNAEARRARMAPQTLDDDNRQSRFKTMAAVCALAGAALVLVSLFGTGTSETGQLVQRTRNQPEAVQVANQEPVSMPQPAIDKAQEMQAWERTAPTASQAKPSTPAAAVEPRVAPVLRQVQLPRPTPTQLAARAAPSVPPPSVHSQPTLERVLQVTRAMPVAPALPPAVESKVEVAAVAPAIAPPPPQPQPSPMVVTAPPVQVAIAPQPVPRPGPTLMEAQPLLSQLLQVMESGRGERILNLLDPEARSKPAAQALSRQYESLVDGARPVRVSHVELKAEPGDGRLLVVGYFRVLAGEQPIGALGKKMVLRAEFASREGSVVITGLSGGPIN